MISFSCSHCGMKFKVKDEFAGRSSKCPTCKQPLVVPAPGQDPGRRCRRPDRRHGQQPGQSRVSMAASPWNQLPPLVPVRGRFRNSWPGGPRRTGVTSSRGDCPRRHGRGAAGRGLRHPPGSRRQVPARPGRRRQEAPLHRGSPDHRPTRTSQHRPHPRTRRGCPEAAVLLA